MPVFNGTSASDFLSNNDNVVAYSQDVTKRIMKKSKTKPFIGIGNDGERTIIKAHKKSCQLGNIVGISLEDDLIEAGATGNVTLNASSEELKTLKQFIKVDRFQHSVPSTESIVNQRVADSFKSRAKGKLTNWGTTKFDRIFFSALSADCTNIVASGHHDSLDTSVIETSNILTTEDISEAKRRALQGVDALGKEAPPLTPVVVNYSEDKGYWEELPMFVMLVGTDSARNLKNDPNWEEAQKQVALRGKENPIFTGALGYWDGVLVLNAGTDTARQSGILTSNGKFCGFSNVKNFNLETYEGKNEQRTELNLFLGASAGQIVVDLGVSYYDYVDKDDPRRMIAAIDRVYGFAKTRFDANANDNLLKDSVFNGKDYGVIAVASSTGRAEK
ncbi:MAG: hypothetical protein CR967_04605 [Proteobacteria bacterium]|nr:MAG: hypothetical protein CR967_04605 [Pseudomonadota bacterium]